MREGGGWVEEGKWEKHGTEGGGLGILTHNLSKLINCLNDFNWYENIESHTHSQIQPFYSMLD